MRLFKSSVEVTGSFGFNVWPTPLSRIANGIGAYSTPQDLAFSYCDAGYCWPGCTGSQLNADGPEMAAAAFILAIR